MNKEKPDWLETLKDAPGYIRGMIGFLTVIGVFILFFLENIYLVIIVALFVAALALLLSCIYILLKKTKPLIVGGRGVYVYAKYRPWATAGIAILIGGLIFTLPQTFTREYIQRAFSRQPTAAPIATLTVTPAVTPSVTVTITPNTTPTAIENSSSAPMVKIEKGKFIMGNDEFANTSPKREVSIHTFWMDIYEVTNEDYYIYTQAENYPPPANWVNGKYPFEKDKHPVAGVSWDDADAYCRFVNKRLPTEAEWEKAARGVNGNIWPWGDEWDHVKANVRETENMGTTPVGSYPLGNSDFGMADMAGNVMEWVNDWYQEDYYTSVPPIDPMGPIGEPVNQNKILRGGAWYDEKENVKTFVRLGIYPPYFPMEPHAAGFRCACDDCQP